MVKDYVVEYDIHILHLQQVKEMVDVDISSEVELYQWERVEQVATSKKGKTRRELKQ